MTDQRPEAAPGLHIDPRDFSREKERDIRMSKRRHLFIRMIIACLLIVSTATYTFAGSEQETVAQNFLKFLRSDKAVQSAQILGRNSLDPSAAPIPVAHLFQLNGGGYIIVANSKDLTPIKAYSLTNDFEALPPAYRTAVLDELEAHVRSMQTGVGRTTQSDAASENRQRWDFLLNLDVARLPLAYTPDTFLLSTTWNQSAPYNKFLPEASGQKTITGCVNTALGQIMKYYGYPSEGRGVVSYTWNEQPLKAVLYRPYNWANMPDKLISDTPEYQTDEVARFMRDIGIANYTNYGVNSSSAGLNSAALIENFGYSNAIQYMNNTDVNAFFATLKSEIDAGRPVFLSFPGHATVADGYASDGAGRKIHVNMGWQGSYNDYYYLDQAVDAGGYSFSTSPGNLDIYFNIKPCSGSDCSWNIEAGDGMSNLVISGNFNYGNDSDRHEVYLKGNTTVSATRGWNYSNIGFYVDFYNLADGTLAFSADDTQQSAQVQAFALPAGKYLVDVSVCGHCDTCGCYSINNYAAYTVTLTTETLTPQEKSTADAAVDRAPVIYNDFRNMLLNSNNIQSYRILIDARDENGDAVTLEVINSNTSAVMAALSNNILEITPVTGVTKIAAKITVKASANGKTSEKSFVVMVSNEDVGFGKTFDVNGLFENQSDFNQHKIILDGACTISGLNGYSNQAFYSSVLDANGNQIIAPDDSTISRTFQRNFYLLGASLKQNPGGAGNYYPYDPGKNDKYTLIVNCPDADDSITTIAGLLGIDLSITESQKGDVNGDGVVDLTDAVLAFQILTGMDTTGKNITPDAHVAGDSKIGLAEVIYILQKLAGLR
jgi:hypothetical protein